VCESIHSSISIHKIVHQQDITMNQQQISTLSARFQAVATVFGTSLLTAIPFEVAVAIDKSPMMLSLLEAQKAVISPDSIPETIRLGNPGKGTFNEGKSLIFIDPNDLTNLINNPGEMALRIAHEIGHTIDPQPTPTMEAFTNPLDYARARSRGEAWALNTESGVFADWNALPGGNPYTDARLSFDATVGGRGLQTELGLVEAVGAAQGWSNARILEERLRVAADMNGKSNPSNEPTATYFQQDVRDFVLNSFGITQQNFREMIPAKGFGTPVVDDVSSGFWSVNFTVPDVNNTYRLFRRNSDGSMVEQRYTEAGDLLSAQTHVGTPFSVVPNTGANGIVVNTLQTPAGTAIGNFFVDAQGASVYNLLGFDQTIVQSTKVIELETGKVVSTSYADGRHELATSDPLGVPTGLTITAPNKDGSQTTANYTYVDGVPILQSSVTPQQIFDDGSRVEIASRRQADGTVQTSKDIYDSDNNLFSSEPIHTGADALANAVGVTGSVLSLIKQVTGRNPQLVPVLASGVNTVIAIQQATNVPTDRVLSGAGAVLGAMRSKFEQKRYQNRSCLWTTCEENRHEWLTNLVANDLDWRMAA
jgi:hypothetical protein